MSLKSIKGVEIFSVGEWNGDKYSIADLDKMVDAFEDPANKSRPFLKLGHDEDQKLLQKDGYPAAGWVGKLYRDGTKLLADFIDIPQKVYELIRNKAYRKVSCEIYWDIQFNGTNYPRMLSAVSLLGGNIPAVNCLDDMLALYGLGSIGEIKHYAKTEPDLIIKKYIFDKENTMAKTESELKLEVELQTEKNRVAELEAGKKKFSADIEAKETEAKDLRAYKADAEKKIEEARSATEKAKHEAVVAGMEATKLVTPAMKPYVLELLGDEKKEYAIQEKKYSKAQLLEQVLKLHAAVHGTNFEGKTLDNKLDGDKESEINKQIEAYAKENKVSYTLAYKSVMKTVNQKAS